MSKDNTSTERKPANSRRRNIMLAPETEAKGEKIATLEKRSFSNLVEVLIDREHDRLGLSAQKETVAA
jgi:hypothetical protein